MSAREILFADSQGRPVALVHPTPREVDFRAIAWELAGIARFNGWTAVGVSVAQHLLIGLDHCKAKLRAHWLLHDCHEARLGDRTRPQLRAEIEVARELYGDAGAEIVEAVARAQRARHDAAIYAAAGLEPPTDEIRAEIKLLDIAVLQTERRDFCAEPTFAWPEDASGVSPLPKRYAPMHRDKAAEHLFRAFVRNLPGLRRYAGDV